MRVRFPLLILATALLAGCGTGPVKRVSPPAASIQQLTVQADGSWDIQLRLQNFSSMAMRFDSASLLLSSGTTEAGQIQASPGVSISPESADVVNVRFTPSTQARQLAAAVLADGQSLPYQLKGEVSAAPDDGRSRSYPIDARSTLHPAPGLPGVLR
jgi:hypothetical protein